VRVLTYILKQADAHLRFAPDWDVLYEEELKAAASFPKAVLSSYPPGFSQSDPPYKGGSQGTRLCTCEFSTSDVEHKIIRINTGNNCRGEEAHPTQIAYIAAGFFFARAEFLVDVPFDPYLVRLDLSTVLSFAQTTQSIQFCIAMVFYGRGNCLKLEGVD
jgi:hypothetical protein